MTSKDEEYPRFASVMNEHYADYNWEGLKVETEDGYILTLFRITGSVQNGPFVIDKPPIVIANGLSNDALLWIKLLESHG